MPTAISGARARFFIGSKEIGWATGVSASENIVQQPIDILGNIDPVEIEPIGRSVTIQATAMRLLGASLAAAGVWAVGETADVINFNSMMAEIYDPITDVTIWRIEGLKCQTRSWNLDSRGLMSTNVSFLALRMFDEQNN
jgi:hypothetical protein